MKNKKWEITEHQLGVLKKAEKLNDIVYIRPNADTIISIDALDSFTTIYINTLFDYKLDSKVALHNLGAVMRSIKNVGDKPVIKVKEDELSIMDEGGKVECKYLFASEDLFEDLLKLYVPEEGYEEESEFIRDWEEMTYSIRTEENAVTFTFTEEMFNNVKKYAGQSENTMAIFVDKIVLYDDAGSRDVDSKDTIILKIESDMSDPNFRLDVDLNLLKKIEPNEYKCTVSDEFVMFENEEAGDTYCLSSNCEQ